MTAAGTLQGSWPVNDPSGVALRLWNDSGHIDVAAADLDHLAWLAADARRRTATPSPDQGPRWTLADLSTHGLLWLINRVVFHPRGFALGISPVDGTWQMLGDGTEPWRFGDNPDGTAIDDVQFARAEAFLAGCRTNPTPAPASSSGPDHQLQPAEPTAHLLERDQPGQAGTDRPRPRWRGRRGR